ncbi:MAG: class I tRNA ligase family protein [Candidatus Pacebacteria bacterium]|nr:class I tRNA ligase family protein [Candidatus Paceibacterota bacterium]
MMDPKFLKPYSPQDTEPKIYKRYEESGFFSPETCVKEGITKPDAKPFTIMMPPPNVTGILHMGHGLMLTIEDILIRYKRMRGFRTLWLPGIDHAAIATQTKVEKDIQKTEKKTRHDLGREEFLKRIEKFADESHETIVSQIKTLGASCDWSREAYTLDEKRSLAVRTVFKKMYDDGLIYRGHRVVNWDPKGQTTVSDDEVSHEETKGKLYTFRYSKDFPIPIATTRPETKVGDTAVAVHPDDARYKEFIGKEFDISFVGVPLRIKIIADEEVDTEYGTGAVGVTPAHSMTDFEIAKRHNLPLKQVINEYAKMMVDTSELKDKKTKEAREIIVEQLKKEGLLEKEEEITINLSTADRSGGVIEPLPKLQWFVAVNKEFARPSGEKTTLKKIMRAAVESGAVKIIPNYFDKTYFHWIDKLGDWCISRQIWFGHRIPVWYDENGNTHHPKIIKVLLARHGESVAHTEHIIAGQLDSPLSKKGRVEAKELAKKLENSKITKIISSDLSRAEETARIVAESCGCKITTYKELREVDYGSLSKEKTVEGYSALRRKIDVNTGESLEELEKRAKNTLEIIKKETNSTEKLLVIGHRTFFSILDSTHKGLSNERFVEEREKWKMNTTEIKTLFFVSSPQEKNLTQDPDTLDTWFSSSLWTFSTLGWPEETEALKIYHPTDILETGYEIIFFWVARMIMMTGYVLGDVPFHTVYLHGTVRDDKGRKMSKSLGNGMDPMDIANEFGADAGRMALVVGNTPGTDTNISKQKIKGYKNFANKIWNASRFVLESIDTVGFDEKAELREEEKKRIEELQALSEDITKDIENYRFYLAAEKIYHYFWHTFADVIIEESKAMLKEGDEKARKSIVLCLYTILATTLKLLHPFMPFVTEEVWGSLPESALKTRGLLMVEEWPIE